MKITCFLVDYWLTYDHETNLDISMSIEMITSIPQKIQDRLNWQGIATRYWPINDARKIPTSQILKQKIKLLLSEFHGSQPTFIFSSSFRFVIPRYPIYYSCLHSSLLDMFAFLRKPYFNSAFSISFAHFTIDGTQSRDSSTMFQELEFAAV